MGQSRFSLNLTTIIGIALAVVTFLLILSFLGSSDKTITVFVARQDIAANKAIEASMVESREVPEENAPPEAILDPNLIIGRYVTGEVFRGDVFTERRVVSGDLTSAEVLTERLGPNDRLISIAADVDGAVAGRIRTGDVVDVIVVASTGLPTVQVEGEAGPVELGGDGRFAQTILQQVRVIDVNLSSDALRQSANDAGEGTSNPAESGSRPIVPGLYTLAVTFEQAELLAMANEVGTFYLTLTPPDAELGTGGPIGVNGFLPTGEKAPALDEN